jgi:hypothetical protein
MCIGIQEVPNFGSYIDLLTQLDPPWLPSKGGLGRLPAQIFERFTYLDCARLRTRSHLKVPEAEDLPARLAKRSLLFPVALLGAAYLVVPVAPKLAGGEVIGMAMPKTAVDEDGKAPAREGDVRFSRKSFGVTPVPS